MPTATAHAADIHVSVGEVKDSRTTGQFFSELELKLKLTGDDVPAIRGVKTIVNRAIDGTGRNILKKEEKTADFESFSDAVSGQTAVTLKLKNPARRAAVVSEISGELRVFMPERDKAATVMVSGDTGPIHVGGAMGTPLVGIYGPTSAERNGPWGTGDLTASRFEQCECHYQRQCHAKSWCLLDVSPREIIDLLDERLAGLTTHA